MLLSFALYSNTSKIVKFIDPLMGTETELQLNYY